MATKVLLFNPDSGVKASISEQMPSWEVEICSDATAIGDAQGNHAYDLIFVPWGKPNTQRNISFLRQTFKSAFIVVYVGLVPDAELNNIIDQGRDHGANAFLGGPFTANALEQWEYKAVHHGVTPTQEKQANELKDLIVGDSVIMEALRVWIVKIASAEESVLITGERGTGKGLIVDAIARLDTKHGNRRQKACKVNSSQFGGEMFESEMFGWEKGAHSKADEKKLGWIEFAGDGILFLDDFQVMPTAHQAKLLKVLHERTYQRMSSTVDQEVRCRIICATNVPLELLVAQGKMSFDVLDRLEVIRVETPRLNDHREDLPQIIDHLVERIAKNRARPVKLTQQAKIYLLGRSFEGNVRQLENILVNASVASAGLPIDVDHLPKLPRFSIKERPQGHAIILPDHLFKDENGIKGIDDGENWVRQSFRYFYFSYLHKEFGGDFKKIFGATGRDKGTAYDRYDDILTPEGWPKLPPRPLRKGPDNPG
jgi:DNA-binding NtrC family response regulator